MKTVDATIVPARCYGEYCEGDCTNSALQAKVLCVGPQGVGKTSFVLRYVGEPFYPDIGATVHAAFTKCPVLVNGKTMVTLNVWDTAGQERFRSLVAMYYRNVRGSFLVFDLTSERSLEDIHLWAQELKKLAGPVVSLCLVGNKCDLVSARKVQQSCIDELARSLNTEYFETSVKDNIGIDKAFEYLGAKVHESLLLETKMLNQNSTASCALNNSERRWKRCCNLC